MKDKQYNQMLTPKMAAEGIKIILDNSTSLLSDAELLFNNDRFERAFALSILAIEESGKIPILLSILLEDNQTELKKKWKQFRTHSEKNWGMWFLNFPMEAETTEELNSLLNNDANFGLEIDNLKQKAIYTDLLKNKIWCSPKLKITKKLSSNTLTTAKKIAGKDLIGLTTEDGLKLFVKHLKPVIKKDEKLKNKAFAECYKEAERLGAISGGLNCAELIRLLLI